MDYFKRKYGEYLNTLLRLKAALRIKEPDDVQIDGIIQRFEITFNKAIETLKAYLNYVGISNYIEEPIYTLKIAFEEGIIYDGELWIEMLEVKNNILDEDYYHKTRKIYNDIKEIYVSLLEKLSSKLNRGE